MEVILIISQARKKTVHFNIFFFFFLNFKGSISKFNYGIKYINLQVLSLSFLTIYIIVSIINKFFFGTPAL